MANARTLGLLHIDWRCGCWFDALPERRFDLIIANPPYVASGDPAMAALAAEPALALDAGPTGLEALAAIVDGAAAHLHPGGGLLLEHGSTQAEAVAGMLEAQGFGGIRSHPDYAGRLRVTVGTVRAWH
jgi:release factor glutamine methyltransferase